MSPSDSLRTHGASIYVEINDRITRIKACRCWRRYWDRPIGFSEFPLSLFQFSKNIIYLSKFHVVIKKLGGPTSKIIFERILCSFKDTGGISYHEIYLPVPRIFSKATMPTAPCYVTIKPPCCSLSKWSRMMRAFANTAWLLAMSFDTHSAITDYLAWMVAFMCNDRFFWARCKHKHKDCSLRLVLVQ